MGPTIKEKSCPYFFFFSPPYFFSHFFCTDSLNSFFFFFLFSFFFLFLSFFLLHRLTLTAIFFLLLHSFSFFSSSQKHMGNFIKKKKNTWVPISQTHKHMILIIHTVFSHSPSGFFFSIWLSQIQKIKPINTWYRSYTLTHKHKPTNMVIHKINLKISSPNTNKT